MNSQPIQRKPRERTRWRPRLEFAEPLSQVATHVTHHFGSRKLSPNRFTLGRKARYAVEHCGTDARVKE